MNRTIHRCRACGGENLIDLFSLGDLHVSDFVDPAKVHDGPRCPVDVVQCDPAPKRGCSLVQLRHTAPQDFLYTRHYWYKSGTTATMREALTEVARAAEARVNLVPNDVVLDVGSNDGTLLRAYRKPGIVRVGVEPATNLVAEGREGINLLVNEFWGTDECWQRMGEWQKATGKELRKPKIITACGMFYDLDDPNPFIENMAKALHDDGVICVQLMCLANMVRMADVGNFCHEHLEYYTLRSIWQMFRKHGLELFDLETNAVNGESYRIWARKMLPSRPYLPSSYQNVLNGYAAEGRELKLFERQTYEDFHGELVKQRDLCMNFLRREHAAGKRIWIYGASTKGNTILQWYTIDRELAPYAADKSPEKWGKATPGTGIQIRSEEDFREANPDYAVVLPYAFLPEFMEREREWRSKGGKFVVPIPYFQVI